MKRIILLLAVTISALAANAQTSSWVRKDIGNGLSVSFPTAPDYAPNQIVSTYQAQSSDAVFMAMIMRNVIPQNYDQFVLAESRWSEAEKKNVTYSFLNNYVNGRISSGGKHLTSSNIKIGRFYGKKFEYSAVNPITGEMGKRFVITLALLKYNKIISFECWYLNNSNASKSEKDGFFNSIKVE